MVIRYFYKSRSTYPAYTVHDLDIMRTALRVNEENNITSFLLREDTSYYQILEGDEAVIMSLIHKIRKDHRHFDFVPLLSQQIETRYFKDWALGMRVLRPADKVLREQLRQLTPNSDAAAKQTMIRDIHRIATRFHQRDKALPPHKAQTSRQTGLFSSASA